MKLKKFEMHQIKTKFSNKYQIKMQNKKTENINLGSNSNAIRLSKRVYVLNVFACSSIRVGMCVCTYQWMCVCGRYNL